MLRTSLNENLEPTPLRTYVAVIARRKWILLITLVVVPVTAVVISLLGKSVYQGTAQVLLSDRDLAGVLTGAQGGGLQDLDRVVDTQARVARTPDLARRVLAAAGVTALGAHQLLDNSDVTPVVDTNVLEFNVRDSDPERAERLATAYARQFVFYTRTIETAAVERALKGVVAELTRLTNQGLRDSALYARLANEAQTLRTISALQTGRAQVLRPAEGADKVEPRPKQAAVFGLFGAILLGLGIVALMEALETRVRTESDVPEALGIPLLGRLAEPPRRLRRNSELAVVMEPDGPNAEAFRILRANVEYANAQLGAKTIMLTSCVRGEGKSTTAANIAASFARLGKHVTLVDFDFRRPSVARNFALSGRHGVSDVVAGRVPLEEAIVRVPITSRNGRPSGPRRRWAGGYTPHPRGRVRSAGESTAVLEVLPTGATPTDVGEFVGGGGISDLLQTLGERADIVFIDAPPALEVSDPMTLMTQVDALIVVARMGLVRYPMLKELRRVLHASSVNALGAVITGAEVMPGYGPYTQYGEDVEPQLPAEDVTFRVFDEPARRASAP
jgi:Mrp family chromosome partitioning ATPase/capsular polysaccharide biosynthesis protein